MLRKEGKGISIMALLLLMLLVHDVNATDEQWCTFNLDNEEFMLNDVAFVTLNCNEFVGEPYRIIWTSNIDGLIKEDSGVIAKNVTFESYLIIDDRFDGEVIAIIPDKAEYKRTFKVVDEDRYFYFSIGEKYKGFRDEKDFKMVNIGKLIAGDNTDPIVGWIIFGVLVWLGFVILLNGPDWIKRRIKK